MAHTIFRSDKMFGTLNPAGLVNVKISADLDNGSVVKIGALATGEREAYSASTPVAGDSLDSLCIVVGPELMYDERKKNLNEYFNDHTLNKGIYRGYRFHKGDEFSMTADGFDGTPAVGSIVEVMAGNKMKVVAEATQNATAIGTIVAKEGDFYVVREQ